MLPSHLQQQLNVLRLHDLGKQEYVTDTSLPGAVLFPELLELHLWDRSRRRYTLPEPSFPASFTTMLYHLATPNLTVLFMDVHSFTAFDEDLLHAFHHFADTSQLRNSLHKLDLYGFLVDNLVDLQTRRTRRSRHPGHRRRTLHFSFAERATLAIGMSFSLSLPERSGRRGFCYRRHSMTSHTQILPSVARHESP